MKSEFAKKEEEILEFWKKNNLFIRSIEDRPEDRPYVFYDGPPFATGLPHYGQILASVIKDLVPRYWTMKGYRVARRWGWDCHGLPIETIAEKELKISGKKQIEEKGVELFNKTARNLVSSFVDQWEKTIERIGRWVDFDNSYKTMDSTYMESVWWALKILWDKGLIYEGLRVLMYCPRCETPVSNAEIAMDSSYRDTTEDSLIVKFKIRPGQRFGNDIEVGDNSYVLAWTTTPWTLPGNVALAVGENIDYTALKIKGKNEIYIIASELVPKIFKEEADKVHDRIKGKDIVGLEYEPLFKVEKVKNSGKRAWYITSADFVKTEEGTGVVHTAVIYGEEDFELGKKIDLPQVPLLDSSGHYNDDAPKFIRGKFYKEAEEPIVDDLKKRDLIYRVERHTHSYPFCWRCEAPLIYNAISSWFINIQKEKQRIIELNEKINWHPEFLKHGRFLNIVKEAPDWNISRNRYWATPLPFFKCPNCKEIVCIGSVAELKEKAINFGEVYKSEKVEELDLHRPYIDQVKLKCNKCEGEMRRTPEVVDCWVESSSMPFAEWHYPFENKEIFEKRFPGQFIGEYIAQTRTWFYYMHVLGVLLFDNIAYENVVSTGTILAEDGSKMSKSKGNFPDPEEVIENFGADSLRFYLMSSVVMRSDNLFFNARDLRDVFNKTTNILYNVLRFYEVYSGDNVNGSKTAAEEEPNLIDRWIFSRAENLVLKAGNYLEQYNTVDYCREIRVFIDDLSTWWVRRSRERMKQGGEGEARALKTLSKILKKLATVIAPVMPFAAEGIWQKVREGKDPISIHLYLWAEADQNAVDSKIEIDMEKARKICELGHSLRSSKGVRVRQPLSKIHFNYKFETNQDEFEQLILSELNVEKIAAKGDLTDAQLAKEGELEVSMDFAIDKRLEELGAVRELSRGIQQLRKSKGLKQGQLVGASYYCSDELKETVEENKTKLMASAALRSLNFKKELRSSEGALEIPLLKCFIDIDEDSKDKS